MLSLTSQPELRLRLLNDCNHFYLVNANVIEHPYVPDPKPILRSSDSPQTLDAAPADLGRSMHKMAVDGVPDLGADVRSQGTVVSPGTGCEGDPVGHSGQIIARVGLPVNGGNEGAAESMRR